MPKPELVKKIPRGFPKGATLAAPRWFTVKDTLQNQNAVKFFAYWKEIAGTKDSPSEKADLVLVKFYMHWPVVSLKLAEPDRTDSVFRMFEGAMPFENPEDYMTEIPKLLGSGGWHALINEVNVHGHLMEAYFSAVDLDRYPPRIDLRTLLRGEAKNQDYVRWLAANNVKTPWDNPAREEEEEMAGAADIVKVALDTVKETSQTAVEATREAAKLQVEAAETRAQIAEDEAEAAAEQAEQRAATEASVEAHAVKASIDMLAHAGTKAVDMITAHAGSQYDPITLMKTAAELTRPQGDSGVSLLVDAIKDSNSKMLQMQEKTLEFMQGVVGIRRNPDGSWSQPQPSGAQENGFERELTRFRTLADLLGFRRPEEQAPAAVHAPKESKPGFWDGVAERPIEFMTMLTTVVTLGANIIYNMTAPKGEKISPQEAMQKAAPPPPIPQPQAQQQQPQNAQFPITDIRRWAGFPAEIEKNFLAHFFGKDSNCSGLTFAEWVLSHGTNGVPNAEGRKLYNSIRTNLGPQKFTQLLQSYAPIWNQVKEDPKSYEQFITEFFNYDEIQKGQAAA